MDEALTPERWRRIEELYHAAQDLVAAERHAFLENACGGDSELQQSVARLLAQDSGVRFLDAPAAGLLDPYSVTAEKGMALTPGDKLGPYEIVSLLGAGGMGEVYRAYDPHLRRDIALKVLPAVSNADPARRQRFEREARAIAALNHPNIVTIYDISRADGVDFIAMELVSGTTLSKLIPQNGMPPGEALRYAADIAGALASAHAAGIIHRDLKPGNVMVTESGVLKVLDFGLAKVVERADSSDLVRTRTLGIATGERTGNGVVLGTPAYMSPEQLEGRKIDARSDIFSFGALLYEMLSGRRAFHGKSTVATLAAILNSEPEPIGVVVRGIPPALAQIVERCLRKDPSKRAQSMADLHIALGELRMEGATTTPRPTFFSSHRTALFVIGLMLLLAGMGAVWWFARRTPPPANRPLTAVPLTIDAGLAACPSFSPDGSEVAYEWDQGRDAPRIFVKLVGPGEPARLTTGTFEETCPAWSPDGKNIAFTRTLSASVRGIFLVPARGGAERRLAEFPRLTTYGIGEYRLSWTPDAKHLIAALPNDVRVYSLFVIALDSGEKVPLPVAGLDARDSLGEPAVSPDAKALVFTRQAGFATHDLRLVELGPDLRTRGGSRPLTSLGSRGAAWTPDSKEVVYSRDSHLWRIGLDPRATPREIPSLGPGNSSPAISKNGRLTFQHFSGDMNIWRQPLFPGGGKGVPPQSLIASVSFEALAEYSPDGTRIAFQSTRSGSHEVWLCDSEGGSCRQLTSFNGPVTGSPRWSPDGRLIAFDSAAAGRYDIYVIDAEGGTPRRMTHDPSNATIPGWSGDGKWIYFCSRRSGRAEIWKLPLSGGTEIQVTRNGGMTAVEAPGASPHLYYTKSEGPGSIFRSRLDGSDETEVAQDEVKRALVVKGDKIFYLRQERRGVVGLRSLSVTGGTSSLIATLTKGLYVGLSISPDLRYALYGQVDSQGSTLMLVEDFR